MRGLVCLWVKRTGARAPDLDRSFLTWLVQQRIEWGRASCYKVCVASALSVSRYVGTVFTYDPGEDPEKERSSSSDSVAADVKLGEKWK